MEVAESQGGGAIEASFSKTFSPASGKKLLVLISCVQHQRNYRVTSEGHYVPEIEYNLERTIILYNSGTYTCQYYYQSSDIDRVNSTLTFTLTTANKLTCTGEDFPSIYTPYYLALEVDG